MANRVYDHQEEASVHARALTKLPQSFLDMAGVLFHWKVAKRPRKRRGDTNEPQVRACAHACFLCALSLTHSFRRGSDTLLTCISAILTLEHYCRKDAMSSTQQTSISASALCKSALSTSLASAKRSGSVRRCTRERERETYTWTDRKASK